LKRWPGYGSPAGGATGKFDPHPLRQRRHARGNFFGGTEIVPLPKSAAFGLIFFASVAEALQAAGQLSD